MREIWKPIEHFEGYSISNFGRVRSEFVDRELMWSFNQAGLPTVGLKDETGRQRRRMVALLVAKEFVTLPDEFSYEVFDTPTHLNGDRQNCRADNLVWRPRWFTVRFHKERRLKEFDYPFRDGGKLLCLETDEIFETLEDASITHGVLSHDIFFKSLLNERRGVFPHWYHYDMIMG